jgi:hypothetical protein
MANDKQELSRLPLGVDFGAFYARSIRRICVKCASDLFRSQGHVDVANEI